MKNDIGNFNANENKSIVQSILPNWIYWLIGGLAFFLFAGTIKYGFVLDDIAVVENNLFVQKGFAGIPDILSTFYWEGFTAANVGLFRPISLIMFAIEHALSPDSPVLHHFVNVLFYALSAVLLLRNLQRWMPQINPWFFFFVTLVFLVHPIHSEVVANIKSRDEIMAFFFFLVCCHFFYRSETRTMKNTVLAGLFFFLALLSKEGVIVLFPILLLLEFRSTISWKKHLVSFAPFIVLMVIWFVWHQWVVGRVPITPYTYHDNALLTTTSIAEQKATAFGIFFRYEMKAFFPYLMSYDYSFPYFSIVGWGSLMAWLGVLSLLGGLFGIVYFFKKNFLLSLGLALLIFPLLMTGNLHFNIGATMADRFLYVPVLGSSILIVFVIGLVRKTIVNTAYSASKVGMTLAPLFLLFAYLTVQRNAAWESNATLFEADYLTAPESARVQYNYATLLQSSIGTNPIPAASVSQKVIDVYRKSLQLDPGAVESSINLGQVYLLSKSYEKAKKVFEDGIKSTKNNPDLWGGKGEAEFNLNDRKNAEVSLDQAIKFGNKLPGVFILRGTIAFDSKQYAIAETTFKKGLEWSPENTNLLLNLGNVYGAMQKLEKARDTFEQLIKVDPSNVQGIYFLEMINKELG